MLAGQRVTPTSSSSSRNAASTAVSPGSRRPPGSAHWAACASQSRCPAAQQESGTAGDVDHVRPARVHRPGGDPVVHRRRIHPVLTDFESTMTTATAACRFVGSVTVRRSWPARCAWICSRKAQRVVPDVTHPARPITDRRLLRGRRTVERRGYMRYSLLLVLASVGRAVRAGGVRRRCLAPDPHMPNMQAGYCPGGGMEFAGLGGLLRRVPYPDGTFWHAIPYSGVPVIGHPRAAVAQAAVRGRWPDPQPAPPGGCGGGPRRPRRSESGCPRSGFAHRPALGGRRGTFIGGRPSRIRPADAPAVEHLAGQSQAAAHVVQRLGERAAGQAHRGRRQRG